MIVGKIIILILMCIGYLYILYAPEIERLPKGDIIIWYNPLWNRQGMERKKIIIRL